MNQRRFFSQLGILTLCVVVVLYMVHHVFDERTSLDFSLIATAFFVILSISMYFLAAKAAISKDKNAFTRLIMLFTFGKLFMTLILVIVYHQTARPASLFFLVPFFLVYIAFTIFETIHLTRLGKIKARG